MYKCLDCGEVFDEDDRQIVNECHTELDDKPMEQRSYCPYCGGDYEEAKMCKCCGEFFLEDELICGYCKDCLEDELTVDSFYAFAKECEELESFVFLKLFGFSVAPEENTYFSIYWCSEIYKRYAAENRRGLQKVIHNYFDESVDLWDCFAEYLESKEKEAKA